MGVEYIPTSRQSTGYECRGIPGGPTKQRRNLKDMIILDSGSTIKATFMNPKFLTNIRKSDNPIIMQTNAGVRKIELEGDLEGFGTVRFDSEQRANIFGLSHMKDMCQHER